MANSLKFFPPEIAHLVDNGFGEFSLTTAINLTQTIDAERPNFLSNGCGQLGDNRGLSVFTYDQVETNGELGSFLFSGPYPGSQFGDILIPVDPRQYYTLSAWVMSGDADGSNYDGTNLQYFGLAPHDSQGSIIFPANYKIYPGSTLTTLAADLNPGDPTMTLTDATGWNNNANFAYSRQFGWWPYVDAGGHEFEEYTYTRNITGTMGAYSVGGAWGAGGIAGNVITLAANWPGPSLLAGTPVQNMNGSGSYLWNVMNAVSVPNAWTRYSAEYGGLVTDGIGAFDLFPPGTAFVKLAFLLNQTGNQNIRYSCIELTHTQESLFLQSPDGTDWEVTVDDEGNLLAEYATGEYLINDQFSDSESATFASRAATPGPAYMYIVDDANDSVSVVDGAFHWEQTTGSNPWGYWGDADGNQLPITRVDGLTVRFRMRRFTVGNFHCFITLRSTTGEPSIADALADAQMRVAGVTTPVFFTTLGNHNTGLAHNFAAANVWDEYAIVLGASGASLHWYDSGAWTQIAYWTEGSNSTLYLSWMNHPSVSSDGEIDFISVLPFTPPGLTVTPPVSTVVAMQTTENGNFDPVAVKSGAVSDWIIDGTPYSDNAPVVALTGSLVDVAFNPDDPTQVTELTIDNDDLVFLPDFSPLVNLTRLQLDSNPAMTGDIADTYANALLEILDLGDTAVSGSLSGISALTALYELSLYNLSGLTGDVVANLNSANFTYINVSLTGVTGDLSNCTNWSSLEVLSAFGTALTYGTGNGAQNWTNASTIDLYDMGWDEATVDRFIADVYAARADWVTGEKTILLGGTNEAPSAAAIAQIEELEDSYEFIISHSGLILYDAFQGTLAAGSVDNSQVTPYPGTVIKRRVNDDTDNTISIGSGVLAWDLWSTINPWITFVDGANSPIQIPRTVGVTLKFKARHTVTAGGVQWSIWLDDSTAEPITTTGQLHFRSQGVGSPTRFLANDSYNVNIADTFPALGTYGIYAVVLKLAGAILYKWNGASWDEIIERSEGVDSVLHLAWANFATGTADSDGDFDYIKVYKNPPPGLSLPEEVSMAYQTDFNGNHAPAATKTGNSPVWVVDGVQYIGNAPIIPLTGSLVNGLIIADHPDELYELYITDQQMVFDINAISVFGLTLFESYNNVLTGDLSTLVMPDMEGFYLVGADLTYGSGGGLTGWVTASDMELDFNGFSQSEVDQILADVLAGQGSWISGFKSLSLYENAFPSAAGLDDAYELRRDYEWNIGVGSSEIIFPFQTEAVNFAPTIVKTGVAPDWYIDGTLYSATSAPTATLPGTPVNVHIVTDGDNVTQLDFTSDGLLTLPLGIETLGSTLSQLRLYNCANLVGDSSSFTNLTLLTILGLNGCTSLTVDLADLSGLFSLISLPMNDTGAVGNLSELLGMPVLATFNANNCALSGTIQTINALTALTNVQVSNNGSITGDASLLTSLTGLTTLLLNGTAVTYGTGGAATNWTSSTNLQFQSNANITTAMLADLISDILAGQGSWVAGAKTLNVSNTDPFDGDTLLNVETLVGTYSWTITYSKLYEGQISSALDDLEEVSGGTIENGSTLDMGRDLTGLHFTNVTVPQGTTVKAYLRFVANAADSADPTIDVYCEDVDDATAFTTTAFDLSGRTITTATDAFPLTDWALNGVYYVDVSSCVNEVFARGGWASGNDLNFLIYGSSPTARRRASSWDNDNTKAAKLFIMPA